MDSVSQFALGASIGEAVLGRKIGNKAPLIGGLVATLPDLDVFIPFDDAVATFTYHRSASHSLFVLAALSPVVTWLILKIRPRLREYRREMFHLVFLALFTHPLLDAFTVYGTQLFWPLTSYPVSGSTIFIVDPAYTLWLLIGFISAMVISRQSNKGHLINNIGLVLSSVYLCWTVAAKVIVDNRAKAALAEQGMAYDRMMSTPAPFNTLVWRIIGRNKSGYFDAFIPVFETDSAIEFSHYHSNDLLLEPISDHWPVQRLRWFTHGFYKVSLQGKSVLITDLRMGLEANYVFKFKVAENDISGPTPVTSVLIQ